MPSIAPFELPKRVDRAIRSVPVTGFSVLQFVRFLLKPLTWTSVGFYAVWTAWMIALLPHPMAVVSLLVQGYSLWFWVKNADELRRLPVCMKETAEPTPTHGESMDPVTVVLAIAGLPALLGIFLPFLPRFIDRDFFVDLDKDPRRRLIEALVHCFEVYHDDPTRGKANREKLRALVREVDTALAFPGIGRLDALTSEHEALYTRLRDWLEDPPDPKGIDR